MPATSVPHLQPQHWGRRGRRIGRSRLSLGLGYLVLNTHTSTRVHTHTHTGNEKTEEQVDLKGRHRHCKEGKFRTEEKGDMNGDEPNTSESTRLQVQFFALQGWGCSYHVISRYSLDQTDVLR